MQVEKELMPIAWHPSRWRDQHVPKDEKKETKKYGHKIQDFFVSVSDFFVPVILDDEDG